MKTWLYIVLVGLIIGTLKELEFNDEPGLYIALAGFIFGTIAKFFGTIIGLPFAAKAEESALCKLMACLCIAVQFIGAVMQFICGWALPILLVISLFN